MAMSDIESYTSDEESAASQQKKVQKAKYFKKVAAKERERIKTREKTKKQ